MTGATIVYTNLSEKILAALPKDPALAKSLYELEEELGVPVSTLQLSLNRLARGGYVVTVRLRRLHKPRVKFHLPP